MRVLKNTPACERDKQGILRHAVCDVPARLFIFDGRCAQAVTAVALVLACLKSDIHDALRLPCTMKSLKSFFFPENVIGYERSLEKIDKSLRSTQVRDGFHNAQHARSFQKDIQFGFDSYLRCFREMYVVMKQFGSA
jgi:hypothetical protein